MNLRDERVVLSKATGEVVTEFWAGVEKIRSSNPDIDEATIVSGFNITLKTWYKPAFDEVLENPGLFKVDLKRRTATTGTIQNAWRSHDKRCIYLDV